MTLAQNSQGSSLMSLLLLLVAAGLMGAVSAWQQRSLLATRGRGVKWLSGTMAGSAVVGGLIILAGVKQPIEPLLGLPLVSAVAWIKLVLIVFALAATSLAAGGVFISFFDRLVHRSSADALAVARHMSRISLPGVAVLMSLGFIIPLAMGMGLAPQAGSALTSVIVGAMLTAAILGALVINAAAMASVLLLLLGGSPDAKDEFPDEPPRGGVWLVVMLVVTPVLALVTYVLFALLMVTMNTTGRGMLLLLGLGQSGQPELLAMLFRWLWLYSLLVMAMAGGVTFMLKLGVAMGPSVRSMQQSGGRLRWWTRSSDQRKNFDAAAWSSSFETSATDQPQVNAPAHEPLAEQPSPAPTSPTSSSSSASAPSSSPAVADEPAQATPMTYERPVQMGVTRPLDHKSSKLPPLTAAPVVTRPSSPVQEPVVAAAAADETTAESLDGVFPTRWHYALMAFLASVFVFYASLIPVKYSPLSFESAMIRFSRIKYYELGIDRRADVLANLVVIVPVTFLLMAALVGRRWGWLRRTACALLTAVLATAYVVGIEFAQEWFPIRTISLNDIQAGLAGAAAGIILWLLLGDYLTHALKLAFLKRGSATAIRQLLWLYLVAMLVYGLFPMDFTLDPHALAKKYEQGRFILLPLVQGNDGIIKTLLIFLRDVLMFLPVGLLAARPWSSSTKLSWGKSLAMIAILATVFELLRVPVFSSHTGTLHVVGRIIGGMAGLAMVPYITKDNGQLSLGEQLRDSTRQTLGAIGGLTLALMAAGALLYPFKFDGGAELFRLKMAHFINWPFQLYYYAGEWTALTKVMVCMGLFMGSGLVMRWGWNASRTRKIQGLVLLMLMVFVIGLGVELGHAASGQRIVHKMSLDQGIDMGIQEQAVDVTDITLSKGMNFSIGQVADVTDLLAYLTGALAGWVLVGLVLPPGDQSKPRRS